MPNIRSAAKRVRQTKSRTERNRAIKTRVKTFRRRVAQAVAAKDKEAAEQALREMTSAVDKAAKSNVIHKNAAARYKSTGAQLVASLAHAQA